MIKGMIVDVDNTLTDFVAMKRAAVDAAIEAMIDAGLRLPKAQMSEKVYKMYEKTGIEDQKVFGEVLTEVYGQIDYRILASGVIAYRKARVGAISTYPHVHLTLMELAKRGIRMVVLSDAPKLQIMLRLVELRLHYLFDEVIALEDTGKTKPASEPFLKALQALGTKPAETIMLGERTDRDIKGASALGIKTVWARYGDTFGTEKSDADYEIDDIIELLDIVKRENKKT